GEREVDRGHATSSQIINFLRLLDFDLCHAVLIIPRIVHLELRIATTVNPLLEEVSEAAACDLLKGALQVCCNDLFLTITLKIGFDRTAEAGLTELMTEHVQYPGTFVVQMSIEEFKAIIVIDMVHNRATIVAVFLQISCLDIVHRILEVIIT